MSKQEDLIGTTVQFLLCSLCAVVIGLYALGPLNHAVIFSWHPILMTTAWIGVALTSVAVKRRGGRTNTLIHAYSMLAVTLLTLGGYYAIHTHKNNIGKPHLQTYHSWTGITVIAGVAIGAVGSMSALHPDFGALRAHKDVRLAHKLFFRGITLLAFVTILSGWYKLTKELLSTVLLAVLEAGIAMMLLRPTAPAPPKANTAV